MAASLLSSPVSDLCLGKPPLRSLPVSATVADAVNFLKSSGEAHVSVWSCGDRDVECRCVGRVSMADVICFMSSDVSLSSPSSAMRATVASVLPAGGGVVVHVEPSSSLLEAIDLILGGAQNLVVPIQTRFSTRKKQHHQKTPAPATLHNGGEYCWLTQEDVVRFLLGSIGLFSPVPALSVDALGVISPDVLAVDYHSPASAAAVQASLTDQTAVAVIDGDNSLVGEISPSALSCGGRDETAAAAVATLSSGDLMAYLGSGWPPPEDLVRAVREGLKERGLEEMLEEYSNSFASISSSSSSSSDDEPGSSSLARKHSWPSRSSSYSARRSETVVCHKKSSLVAVMIQAIAHRVNYVWVIEEDCSLVGIVTFSNMLEVFREQYLQSMA